MKAKGYALLLKTQYNSAKAAGTQSGFTYGVRTTVKGGKLNADLCDAGEELAEEVKAEERGQWQWRLGCMGRPLPGAALEDSADDLKGIANYEGLCS